MSNGQALNNLERHQVGRFSLSLLERHEEISETLDLFDPSRSALENSAHLSRATDLYRAKPEKFEELRKALIQDQEFVHVELLHKASDLGIPYQIFALHKSGKELFYDGVVYRLTEAVQNDPFSLADLEKLTGYGVRFDNIIVAFENSLSKVIPLPHIYSFTSKIFYTVSLSDWEDIGIKAEGDVNLRLTCTDMNIVTITALIFAETGKDYEVYLGDRQKTLQMIAHETFDHFELNSFRSLLDKQREGLHVIKNTAINEMDGAISPFYKLGAKHKNWISIKGSWKKLRGIYKVLNQFDLLIQTYQYVIENRWAYFNGPRQIWPAGEEKDSEEQIQHPCPNFFDAKLLTLT